MSNASEKCNRYNSYIINNQTVFKISTAYEGIPQNFAVNIIAYIILILMFIFLRKKAWNYGKLSWINKPISLVAASMITESHDIDRGDDSNHGEKYALNGKKTATFIENVMRWIPLFIKINDEELRKRAGSDAVIYCKFQRHLIFLVAVMMCFSLIIIVPLNLQGGLLENSNTNNFATLTIGNVESHNPALWGHFIVSLVLMLFAFFLSNRFLQSVDDESWTQVSSTIMISNIPTQCCDEISIKAHFEEAFPLLKVRRIQFTYKVDKLIGIYSQKVSAEEALEFCYDELKRTGEHVKVVPYVCGRMITCQCCQSGKCEPVDGIEFYTAQVIRLSNLFLEEKAHIIDCHKLPIVFVSFINVKQAQIVRSDYIYQNYCCLNKSSVHTSSLSQQLDTRKWNVVCAPNADDILWQNLHKRGIKWWIPVVLVNVVVAFVVILLSTPSMILNLINQFKIPQKLEELNISPLIAQVLPSLILVLVNSLMPTLVYWSDQLSGHSTKTNQNLAVMNKLYAVLVTTVLILPSLGLNSVPAMLKWLFPESSTTLPSKFMWECIFMPDGGALFCNYLISASFIGTALELLRFGQLFLFTCKMCSSKSRAEDKSIAQTILWEFPFGLGYAWTLALFSMVSAYTVIVPIITPFGLVYLILKHAVDRYNLIHVNIPSEIHNSVHTNAAQLMQIGLVLTQATVTIFVTLRRGSADSLAICCVVAFVLGILLACGRTIVRWIMRMACIKYSLITSGKSSVDGETKTAYKARIDDDDEGDEGFVLVDEFKNSKYLPRQITIDEPVNIDDLIRRKSLISSPSVIQSN